MAKGLDLSPPQHSHEDGSTRDGPGTGRDSPCNQCWLPCKTINLNHDSGRGWLVFPVLGGPGPGASGASQGPPKRLFSRSLQASGASQAQGRCQNHVWLLKTRVLIVKIFRWLTKMDLTEFRSLNLFSRFGWLGCLRRRGAGECVRWPSTVRVRP